MDNLFDAGSKQMSFNEFRKLITDSFQNAAMHFRQLETSELMHSEIEINLLMRSPATDKSKLAYFDLYPLRHNHGIFSFKLYADVLLPLIKHNQLAQLNRIWIHEIMHMVDYIELLRNLKLSEEKIHRNEAFGNSFFFSEIRKDKHVVLFNLLMHFRAEGIATLTEYIFSGAKPSIADSFSAINQFDAIVERAVTIISKMETNLGELNLFLQNVYPHAYKIGAGVILYGLAEKHPEDEMIKMINKCILENRTCLDIADSDIIMKICDFGSFDFVRYCFNKDYLAAEIRFLTSTYSTNIGIYKSFFSLLNKVANNSDSHGFKTLMEKIIRKPMDLPVIEKEFVKLIKEPHVPDEIKLAADELLSELQRNNACEISHLALSYLFDTHDILDDSIDYFGYLDDMEVMNTALTLVDSCKR